jgi:hypothetical protein
MKFHVEFILVSGEVPGSHLYEWSAIRDVFEKIISLKKGALFGP